MALKFLFVLVRCNLNLERREKERNAECYLGKYVEYYPPLARESHPHALSLKKKQLLFEEKMAL